MVTAISKRQITYIVFAHADDEYASWSLIHTSPSNYPVFCMLTRGERTGYCPSPHYDDGEDRHSLLPAPKGSEECKTARIDSLKSFLGRMAELDPYIENPAYVGTRTGVSGHGRVSDRDYLLHAGDKAALLVFDLGDGDLRENEAVWAVRSAQQAKAAGDLPDLPDYSVISASYRNAVRYEAADGCRYYDHPDHRAVHRAVWNTDFGTSGRQWGATAHCNSDRGRTDAIPQFIHEHAFKKEPNANNIGAYQQSYGWLANGYWDYYHHINTKLEQRHWTRF